MVAADSLLLSAAHDVALLDLDGVVYVGRSQVPHAAESIAVARASGMRIIYVTNNASRPAREVREHLVEFGLDPEPAEVITSAQIAATVLAERFPAGSRILVVGGRGLVEAVAEAGLDPVTKFADDPVAVVQGFGPEISWKSLAEASYAIRAGVPWLATNADLTVPTAQGIAPGNGALVLAVATATGTYPEVVGKPEPVVFAAAAARFGSRRPLVVGDRLDTDIAGAVSAEMPSLLVLTGVTDLRGTATAAPALRPTYVAPDLRWLAKPMWSARRDGDGFRCADARADVVDGVARIDVGPDPVAAIQAAMALAWAELDAGRPLDLEPALALLAGALGPLAR